MLQVIGLVSHRFGIVLKFVKMHSLEINTLCEKMQNIFKYASYITLFF